MNQSTPPDAALDPAAFFVPEHDYVRLVRYMVHRYGSGGLPCPTYRETADLLSPQVGWIVDPVCLKNAFNRHRKKHNNEWNH